MWAALLLLLLLLLGLIFGPVQKVAAVSVLFLDSVGGLRVLPPPESDRGGGLAAPHEVVGTPLVHCLQKTEKFPFVRSAYS